MLFQNMKFRKCDEETHRHQLVTGDLEIAIAQGSLFAPPPAGLLTGKLHQRLLKVALQESRCTNYSEIIFLSVEVNGMSLMYLRTD